MLDLACATFTESKQRGFMHNIVCFLVGNVCVFMIRLHANVNFANVDRDDWDTNAYVCVADLFR